MRVYLVRHGETEWNSMRKLQGQTDIPLNEYGIELAEITAKELKDIKFDRIFSSPLIRAVQTAEILRGDRDLEIKTDDRMKEINFGTCEGDIIPRFGDETDSPIWQFEFDTDNYIPAKGGETFAQIYARSMEFFKECIIPLEGECENVLMVGHGCFNRTLLNPIMGRPLSIFWDIKLDNCAVSIIDITGGQATVIEPGKKYYERVRKPGDTIDMTDIYG